MVQDVCVFLDREQGAKKILENKGLKLHSIVTLTQMLTILKEDIKRFPHLEGVTIKFA